MTPIHVEAFWHEGRGPELVRLHWDESGTILSAADYHNPDYLRSEPASRVRFVRSQVAMVTPEEVINYVTPGPMLSVHRPAAMFDLGRSTWLESFAPRHLGACRHFRLMFYDQLLDVIAEAVEVGQASSLPLNTKNARIAAAGNVEAPAWSTLVSRGYQVQRSSQGLTARGPLGEFIADGALSLLGLVALAEARGARWQASDDDVAGFLHATLADPDHHEK